MGPPSVGSVDIRVLGPLEVVLEGRPVDVAGRRERAVLALLAIEVGRPVEVTRLTELLWGADPPRTADKTLQTFVSRLRRVLGARADRLVRRERSYLLDLPAEATDLGRFRSCVRGAARVSAAGDVAAEVAALEAAVAFWRGEHAADLGGTTTAAAIEQLLAGERRAAVEALIAARVAAGELEAAVAAAENELVAHPDHEPVWALLMQAHADAGRPTAALEAYERARRWLADELGLDPSPSLTELHARVLRGEALSRPVDPVLGVAAPGASRTSTTGLLATSDPSGRRTRPPPTLAPLVGRHDEVRGLRTALANDRLVTLTGTGGVGKTRLAIEGVASSGDVVWCDLTRLEPDGAVEEAVAAAVGVVVPPGVATVAAVATDLAGGPNTLVLDNCEHVLDGVRRAAVELLRSCPDLTVLATSRQPLAIAGERVLPVMPLSTEAGGPAAALLAAAVERAGGGAPLAEERELLERVCRRLDGLPLALELAAPAVRTLGLRGVLDGLTRRFQLLDVAWDATGRERDLRGTVAWSETLLLAPTRHILRATSVFAGPFTSAMVGEVCAAPASDVDTELAALVDRSLVEPVPGTPRRYRLLENVRAYGREALGGSALDGLRRRHVDWIASRCDHVFDRFWEDDEVWLVRSLTEVIDEVRAAVDWALASGDADAGLRMAAGLHGPMLLGVRTDVAAWVQQLIERFGDVEHPRLAAAWGGLAHWLLVCEGNGDGAAAAAERAAAVAGDGPSPGVLWQYRIEVALRAYDVDEAQRLLDEARAGGLSAGWDHIMEAGIVPTEDALGRRDRAVERLHRLAPVAERSACLVLREMSRMGTVLIEHEDDPRHVLSVMRDVLATVLAADIRYMAQLVTMVTATYAGRCGERDLAVSTFEDVLGRWGAVGAWRYEWNTIREVTGLLASVRADEDVVVLDAAGRRSPTAPGLVGEQLQVLDAAVTAARDRLPRDVFADATLRGSAMTDREALAYAKGALARLGA
jgi:predicted ATPase/DNA-binding SARP family transcriptional activator